MGELNAVPMRINGVEGAAGQVKISGGPGVLETFGAPAPAAHVHAAGDVTSGQFPLARMPRAAAGSFLEGNGVGANPIFNALVEGNIPDHMSKNKIAFTLNKILKGAGPGADPTLIDVPGGGAPTKEFSVAIYYGTEVASAGALINGGTDSGWAMFLVPQDFNAITSIEVILRPLATGASMHFNISTLYGAYDGEAYNTRGETAVARDIGATVAGQNLANDISDLVDAAALAAGDWLLVWMQYNATAIVGNAYMYGIRFKYT